MNANRSFRRRLAAIWAFGLVAVVGCVDNSPPVQTSAVPVGVKPHPAGPLVRPIELPQPSQRLGTAVVVLIDTSGSMAQLVANDTGSQQPKYEIARDALARIVQVTDNWHTAHTDPTLFLGLVSFSSMCKTVLPIAEFDAAQARAALQRVPPPAGGTAIGLAIEEGFKSLYSTGCIRKHLVCVTDGQNTVATPPEIIASQLHAQTKGDVEIHFVAFDTAAGQFDFLKNVNGSVVEAADGSQLESRLVDLYEKRILVEAMPAEKE